MRENERKGEKKQGRKGDLGGGTCRQTEREIGERETERG